MKKKSHALCGAFLCIIAAVGLCGCHKKGKPSENVTPSISVEPGQTTVTPLPSQQPTEAPELTQLVKSGKLPALDRRIPKKEDQLRDSAAYNGIYGGTLVFATEQAMPLTGYLFSEGLVALSAEGEVIPNLAKKIEASADRKTYTFVLREGTRWSDGTLFTADDCVFYYNSLCLSGSTGQPVPSIFLTDTGKKASIEKISTYSFRIVFPEAVPDFFRRFAVAGGICFAPEHYYVNLLPEYMGEDAAEAKAADMGYAGIKEMIAGVMNNPWNHAEIPSLNSFLLSKKAEECDITAVTYAFERNPYYFKTDLDGRQLPYISRVEFTRISGPSQGILLTTEGYLSAYALESSQIAEAERMAEHGGYHLVKWSSSLTYAIKNSLNGFPVTMPPEAAYRAIGAGHAETWYFQ